MAMLFEALQLRDLKLENRIIVSPMCQYSAVDGNATDWHMMHLGSMAVSGAGMLVIEATAVSPEGRITPGCLGLYNDANEAALKPILRAIRAHAPLPIGMQIGHAGRKASSRAPWEGGGLIAADAPGGWQPVGPSALAHIPGEPPARELSAVEIEGVIADFVATAKRAERLGIDALELHAAHGYLLHSFLSPIANQRSDAWGGSLENRMRLPLAVFDAVRAVWPAHKPLGIRISATDWVESGWDVAQSIELARALKSRHCDWLDCSSGGVAPAQQKITVGPGYQLPFAAEIRHAVPGLPIIGVGMITDPQQAEDALQQGVCDMVALARGLLYNPRWPWHAAAVLGGQINAPSQYWRSPPREAAQVIRASKFGSR